MFDMTSMYNEKNIYTFYSTFQNINLTCYFKFSIKMIRENLLHCFVRQNVCILLILTDMVMIQNIVTGCFETGSSVFKK